MRTLVTTVLPMKKLNRDRYRLPAWFVKTYNIAYSRKQADESIQDYFQEQNIVGISDIDTRQLVRHIRDKGAMNAIISSEILDIEELKAKLAEVPSMDGLELSSQVSTTETYTFGNEDATLPCCGA
jgi:carbamoyl-phosphate synthase small subunit